MTSNPNPSPELLPCPFCEGVAISVRVDRAGRSGRYRCLCLSCSCRTDDLEARVAAIDAWNTRTLSPQTLPAPGEVEAIEAAARAMCDRVNGIGDYDENIEQRRSGWVAQAKAGIDAYLPLMPPTNAPEEVVEAPANGEPDPAWRAIRRAIDQFVGRVPVISKHCAVHNTVLADTVARLDAAGDREAADTIVWLCWFRALDCERERFLLADAAEKFATVAAANDEGVAEVAFRAGHRAARIRYVPAEPNGPTRFEDVDWKDAAIRLSSQGGGKA